MTIRSERALKVALVACQPVDVVLTAYALFYVHGACEMNPMLGWLGASPASFVFFLMLKLGLALKVYSGSVASFKDWTVLWAVVAIHAVAMTWNAACLVAVACFQFHR